jgi:hypothetical protein
MALVKCRNVWLSIVNKNNLLINKDVLQYEKVYVKYGDTLENRGPQIFQKSISHLKVLGAQKSDTQQFHTEDAYILGVTVQILVPTATWRSGFVYLGIKKSSSSGL